MNIFKFKYIIYLIFFILLISLISLKNFNFAFQFIFTQDGLISEYLNFMIKNLFLDETVLKETPINYIYNELITKNFKIFNILFSYTQILIGFIIFIVFYIYLQNKISIKKSLISSGIIKIIYLIVNYFDILTIYNFNIYFNIIMIILFFYTLIFIKKTLVERLNFIIVLGFLFLFYSIFVVFCFAQKFYHR